MAGKAAFVVGQRRFVQTMRKAGADLDELKDVNRQAAHVAMQVARGITPRGPTGRLAKSTRAGATRKAGVIRAGRKSIPYAGVINYGWPRRHIGGQLYLNNAVKQTEPVWTALYETYVRKTVSQIKGA